MKSIKFVYNFLMLIYLIGLIFNPLVNADIIDPYSNEKIIMTSYKIDNLNMYDDYEFFLYGNIVGYQKIIANKSISFYKFGYPSIYAVKLNEFLEISIDNYENIPDGLLENYSSVIKSNIALTSIYGKVPKNDPLKSVHIILTIISIDENCLNINKSKIIFSYTDGTTEEKSINLQYKLPEPSRSAVLPYWFESLWFIWIPIFALIGIGSSRMYRKKIIRE